jgi:hypothetical protein
VSNKVVNIGINKPKGVRESMIISHIHCAMCLEEVPEGLSAGEYAMNEVGLTKVGIQVWCVRHNANVLHLDFEGFRHPPTAGNG